MRNMQSEEIAITSTSVAPIFTCNSTTPSTMISVLLATILLSVIDAHDNLITLRALLDSDSESSYITSDCFKWLELPMRSSCTVASGFSDSSITHVDGTSRLTICPHFNSLPRSPGIFFTIIM